MPVGSRTFWLPRRGNSPDEYEDAFAAGRGVRAICRGRWGHGGLFYGVVGPALGRGLRLRMRSATSAVAVLAARRPGAMGHRRSRPEARIGTPITGWNKGAFAAFLGIVLTASPQGTCQWQAVAVGDTCLFHTRDSVLLRAFPLDRSDQFNNRPQLVGSRMSVGDVRKRQRLWTDGCGQPGDRLWAMTDALAKWCLVEHEAGGNPWRELESLLGSPQTGEAIHFAAVDRRAPRLGPPAQRRRNPSRHPLVGGGSWVGRHRTTTTRPSENLRHSMSDEELRGGQAALDDQQLPMVWAGSFASVYRINCPATGKSWALKCFTREVTARQERYRHIAAALEAARLPFTVPFVYLERGIQVRGQWFPAVKMEWVEGQTLNRFVEESLEKPRDARGNCSICGRSWPPGSARPASPMPTSSTATSCWCPCPTASWP